MNRVGNAARGAFRIEARDVFWSDRIGVALVFIQTHFKRGKSQIHVVNVAESDVKSHLNAVGQVQFKSYSVYRYYFADYAEAQESQNGVYRRCADLEGDNSRVVENFQSQTVGIGDSRVGIIYIQIPVIGIAGLDERVAQVCDGVNRGVGNARFGVYI